MEISGIVLSGGLSTRMGEDKGMTLFNGKSLIDYPLELLLPLCKTVFISTNNEAYARLGYPIVFDLHKNIGPIGGLFSALLSSKTEWNLVLPCDMPSLKKATLKNLINIGKGNKATVLAASDKLLIPVAGMYHKSVTEQLKLQIEHENYKIQDFLKSIGAIPYVVDDLEEIKNINSPSDLI